MPADIHEISTEGTSVLQRRLLPGNMCCYTAQSSTTQDDALISVYCDTNDNATNIYVVPLPSPQQNADKNLADYMQEHCTEETLTKQVIAGASVDLEFISPKHGEMKLKIGHIALDKLI